MKKVVLLGDSIRHAGYGRPVEENLSGEFEVWQPNDNCRFAKYTLRGLFDWKENMKNADIIHWNNGLWDVCDIFGDGHFTPKDEYVETMVRLAKLMKQRAKTVIFATTTPVRDDNPYNKNCNIEAFNNALVPRLREIGVVINDLYSVISKDIEKYIREDDKIHLTDEGIAVATEMVEGIIRSEAEKISETDKTVEIEQSVEMGAPVLT